MDLVHSRKGGLRPRVHEPLLQGVSLNQFYTLIQSTAPLHHREKGGGKDLRVSLNSRISYTGNFKETSLIKIYCTPTECWAVGGTEQTKSTVSSQKNKTRAGSGDSHFFGVHFGF